jgi:hypothetical protein
MALFTRSGYTLTTRPTAGLPAASTTFSATSPLAGRSTSSVAPFSPATQRDFASTAA